MAEALLHVVDPDDITTWDVEKLDELSVFAVAEDPGFSLTDAPVEFDVPPHDPDRDEESMYSTVEA